MTTVVPASFSLKTDLKLTIILAIAAAIATAALFPYLFVVMPQVLAKIPASVPLWLLVVAQSAQAGVVLGILALLGLLMGRRVGLDAPWLRALANGTARPHLPWLSIVVAGLVTGIAMCALDPLFAAHMPRPTSALPAPGGTASAGVGFLASFYGGIGEELLMRLFVMTGVVWLLSLLRRGNNAPWMFWIGVLVAALLFGAGHLPAAAEIWPLDGIVIARTLLLNGVGGLVFGWLYWKRGLEAAMIAHFSADLVLHVFAPLLFG